MTDPHGAIRARVRARLGGFDRPLRILAEAVCGEADATIDWVAVEPDGRACVVLVAEGESEPGLVAVGLAQRAWIERRLADWLQLAPTLGVRREVRARLLLLAGAHPPLTAAAARAADADGITLAVLPELAGGETRPPRAEPPREPRERLPGPGFRTGLGENDLDITPEERATLLDAPPRGAAS